MRRTILLIEDNDIDVHTVQSVLAKSYPDVALYVSRDGASALQSINEPAVRRECILILLDLEMPRLSGLELLNQIKGNPAMRPVPVVVFSVSDDPKTVQSAYAFGANAFVRKPEKSEDLQVAIASLLEFWISRNVSIQQAQDAANR